MANSTANPPADSEYPTPAHLPALAVPLALVGSPRWEEATLTRDNYNCRLSSASLGTDRRSLTAVSISAKLPLAIFEIDLNGKSDTISPASVSRYYDAMYYCLLCAWTVHGYYQPRVLNVAV